MNGRGCRLSRGSQFRLPTSRLHGTRPAATARLWAGALLGLLLVFGSGLPSQAEELRRSMGTLRPLLMGDAHVAVADEASVLFYNPAGLAWIRETSVEFLNPLFVFNEPVRIALVDQDKFSAELDKVAQDIEDEQYETLLSREFFSNITIRTPVVVFPDKGLVLGLGEEALANLQVLGTRVVPLVRVELFADVVGVIGGFGKAGTHFSYGFNVKVISRRGVDRTYSAGDLAATADSENGFEGRPEWKDLDRDVTFTEFGLDLGVVWRLPLAEHWTPRIGLSALNIGGYDGADGLRGMEFGPREDKFSPPQAGTLPQINTVGMAISPLWQGIRFTFAADFVDFTRTALPGPEPGKRVRIGGEIGLFPHPDGSARLGILAGWNGGHPTYGILSRVWIFEVGFGVHTVELGNAIGANPDRRTAFVIGFRF